MSFRRFYEAAKEGERIFNTFKEQGVNTKYRVLALLELHKLKEMPRRKLGEAIGISNDGQLTDSVLNPLKKDDYIQVSIEKEGIVSITSTGEGLVNCVMEDCGYYNLRNYNPRD